eukprot:354220-Chlamydomonas_euryale.AAC.1
MVNGCATRCCNAAVHATQHTTEAMRFAVEQRTLCGCVPRYSASTPRCVWLAPSLSVRARRGVCCRLTPRPCKHAEVCVCVWLIHTSSLQIRRDVRGQPAACQGRAGRVHVDDPPLAVGDRRLRVPGVRGRVHGRVCAALWGAGVVPAGA